MQRSRVEVQQSHRICVILPVLNEAQNIEYVLRGIDRVLAGRDFAVCLVDDGSCDGTIDIIARLMMDEPAHHLHLIRRSQKFRGCQRCGAMREALDWALSDPRVEILIEMDGDGSHRAEELTSGIEILERGRSDVVIASKYLSGSRVTNRPWARRVVSMVCNNVGKFLLSRKISDYSNGFRFYNRLAGEEIARTVIHYTSPIYLMEALAIWLNAGLRIGQFPSHYIGRNEGMSKIRVIDLAKAAVGIFDIALRFYVLGFAVAKTRKIETTSGVEQ